MADKRPYNLDVQASLDFGLSLIVDETGNSESKQILLNTLRGGVVYTLNTSLAATNVSFANYNVASVTITQDCVITISDVPSNSRNMLMVTKPSDNIVSFDGITGTLDSSQVGRTSLIFDVTDRNGNISVDQVNNQFSGSLSSSDITSDDGTITTFNYFNWIINNNICKFEASFTITSGGLHNIFEIDIANFDVTKYNSGYTSCSLFYDIDGTTYTVRTSKIKEDSLYLQLSQPTVSGEAVNILLNDSFIIT